MEHASEPKQVIVFRRDLLANGRVSSGKIAAQVAHAAMLWIVDRIRRETRMTLTETSWLFGSMTKIVVGCEDLTEMRALAQRALLLGLPTFIVTDEGRTAFDGVPTQTALAIGPGACVDVDAVTGNLKTLR